MRFRVTGFGTPAACWSAESEMDCVNGLRKLIEDGYISSSEEPVHPISQTVSNMLRSSIGKEPINCWVERIVGSSRRAGICHSVISNRGSVPDGAILGALQKYQRSHRQKTEIFEYSFHGLPRFEHFHVLHDCNFINGSCECRWHRQPGFPGAKHRFLPWSQITSSHLHNIGIYFNSGGRRLYNHQERGTNQGFICNVKGHTGASGVEQVDRNQSILASCDMGRQDAYDAEDGGSSRRTTNSNASRYVERHFTHNKQASKMEELQEFIIHKITVPISQIISTPYFYNSKWNWCTRQTRMYESAIQIVSRKFLHYSVRDYINLYESIEPQFMAYNGNFEGTY